MGGATFQFPGLADGRIGEGSGGKKLPGGMVDVAVMQSLARMEGLAEFLDSYGQVIVDECFFAAIQTLVYY